ncbi:MAG TPA: RDD family protein [Burkholderiaceae bacterium]|jgi:uncharacterized RDD family membrane protein YckC
MSTSPSEVPDEVISYVGFWPRVGAALIDTIVVMVVMEILLRILGLNVEVAESVSLDASSLLLDVNDPHVLLRLMVNHVLPAIAVVALWLRFGATPGKMAIGAHVVDAQTLGPLTTGQSIGRYLGYYVSTIPFCLGLIWVAFDARKQGWHDKLAGTVVIRKKPRQNPEPREPGKA